MWGLGRYVDRVRGVNDIQVFRERLPSPGDSFVQCSSRDVFHAFHELYQLVFGTWANRGESNSAVAHHDGGDTMPGRGCYLLVPANLTVEMGVNVHKAWCYQLALGVYFSLSAAVYVANLNNSTVRDRYVSGEAFGAGSINNGSVSNNDVIVHCDPPAQAPAELAMPSHAIRCSIISFAPCARSDSPLPNWLPLRRL